MTYAICPACGAPAEVTDHFSLGGTSGPLEQVKIVCTSGGHWFTPLADDVVALPEAQAA